jgi:hypothetical protein
MSKGSDLLVAVLKKRRVERICGVPGEESQRSYPDPEAFERAQILGILTSWRPMYDVWLN